MVSQYRSQTIHLHRIRKQIRPPLYHHLTGGQAIQVAIAHTVQVATFMVIPNLITNGALIIGQATTKTCQTIGTTYLAMVLVGRRHLVEQQHLVGRRVQIPLLNKLLKIKAQSCGKKLVN